MSAAAYAMRYIERFNFKLVALHGKAPVIAGWNLDENLISTAAVASAHWSRNPHDNLGACLEPSGLVSLDCDYLDGARQVLATEGIDLDVLMQNTPTIIGRAPRLEFAAPAVPLSRKSVVWPPKTAGEKPVTVIEFRAGRVQDVLPPSIHPATHRPYRWHTPPRDGFPPLPDALLRIWQDFDRFKHRARNLCPWAPPEPTPQPTAPRTARLRNPTAPSVIREFNAAHDIAAILEAHGYQRAGKKRWKSPNGHGIAGVTLLPSGKIYCHHASDAALSGEHALDAFDVFRVLDHGGDYRAAVKAAADALGLNREHAA